MNFQMMTDDELHGSTVKAAKQERESAINLLNHLVEVKRRHLYSRFKGGSLYSYCTKELKMSEGDAWRKMNSAELLDRQPGLGPKLQSGEITQTHLAVASAFFKAEGTPEADKPAIIESLSNTSTAEAKDKLILRSKKPEKHLRERRLRKTKELTQLTLYIDQDAIADLERLREVWSHAIPKGEFGKIIARAAKEAVAKNDPLRKAEATEARKSKAEARKAQAKASAEAREGASRTRASAEVREPSARSKADLEDRDRNVSTSTAAASTISNACSTTNPPAPGEIAASYVAGRTTRQTSPPAPGELTKAEIKRKVWLRDNARCTYVDPKTKERCDSRHFIEEDHITPAAMGGEDSLENLRLRCRVHNQRHAIDWYGLSKMRKYVKAPRASYVV